MMKVFYMRDKLHLKTVTPELLHNSCQPAIDCASYYFLLKMFIQERSNLPFGPVHKVRKFLLLFKLNHVRNTNFDTTEYD